MYLIQNLFLFYEYFVLIDSINLYFFNKNSKASAKKVGMSPYMANRELELFCFIYFSHIRLLKYIL